MKEYRVGNFLYKDNGKYLEISDISGQFSFKVSPFSNSGLIIAAALDRKGELDSFLRAYASILLMFVNSVPDYIYFESMVKASNECYKRVGASLGIFDDISKEEDDKILNEVRTELEEIEKLKNE